MSAEVNESALRLLETRRSAATANLGEPGPSTETLKRMLTIAARVPDHGSLAPWRFVVVAGAERAALAETLIASLSDAAHKMPETERAIAEQKIRKVFLIAPTIVIVVSRPVTGAAIPPAEQFLSAGACCMNLLTAAAASGFAANWVTGWAAGHPIAHAGLGIQAGESIAGIVLIGTASAPTPERPRPSLDAIVTHWRPSPHA